MKYISLLPVHCSGKTRIKGSIGNVTFPAGEPAVTEMKLGGGNANPAYLEGQPADVRKLRIIDCEEKVVAITARE